MFRLKRPDVFPADDLGLVKAAQNIYKLRQRPSKQRLLAIADAWRPYRSVAAWYLWRSLTLERTMNEELRTKNEERRTKNENTKNTKDTKSTKNTKATKKGTKATKENTKGTKKSTKSRAEKRMTITRARKRS